MDKAPRPNPTPSVRQYKIDVTGFDFESVWALATSAPRARVIVAQAFADAGWGTLDEGMAHIRSCRLDGGPPRPLISPRLGPEGLCRSGIRVDRRDARVKLEAQRETTAQLRAEIDRLRAELRRAACNVRAMSRCSKMSSPHSTPLAQLADKLDAMARSRSS